MSRLVVIAMGVAALGVTASAHAEIVMKACGAKYQAAKAAKTLPAGQTWNQFLAQCRGTATPAAATPAAKPVAAAPAAKAVTSSPKAPSAAMAAMHDRQRKCGQQWQADKAAGKIPAGQKWPQYWSACNTRLKG